MATVHQPGPSRSPAPPPTAPTPEDPREHEPVRDPPIYPEHDDVGVEEVRPVDHASGVETPGACAHDSAE